MSKKESTPYTTHSGMPIKSRHLKDNGERMLFAPFYVKKTQALADVLQEGKIKPDEDVIVNELQNGSVIVLLKKQLAYHHVAQGEHDGEAWMVWF